MLQGKRVVLGISGGIAAFKSAAFASKLVQAGAEVKVVMTEGAKKFVTPLTFQALTRHPVYDDTFSEPDPSEIAHIQLADWADVIIIAPATANLIGKLANGVADDMLSTMLLATKAPIYLAPAMNVNMYEHPAVQRNMQQLAKDGYRLLEPGAGYLACGWIGKGRMPEPEDLLKTIEVHFTPPSSSLAGKKIVITAGPTQETIDPIRFFTNRSSGKMGYALAKAARDFGGNVTLISGPTSLEKPDGVSVVNVKSAQDMYEAVLAEFSDADVVIKTAAVADYRPRVVHEQKVKKKDGDWVIELERTVDILKTLGEKKESQFLVGFAAESQEVETYAQRKLKEKNADMIVANNVTEEGAGFQTDTNRVTVYFKQGDVKPLPLMTKDEVAHRLIMMISEQLEKGRENQ
ncbi:bifunctional phosphopantothenoylcysteine decarboxylase/phosphopantothenate--cysteine ligase CoaBC [Halalkalibacterium halodurans]|jgi:phosphopantothenoylcysteine decarboxylase/phosphopantothenate--cysteine ligase|uniref:bifunctional phosphopantothenoylcysteine decarboxylase/phosphopantothenate--cysteine ligase CoaBC n=1 Tax=Halalkalibacterium halodurans TaxID=86665 RepID=UPI002E21622C|nr:bifunctional phosphopantothenoylcysteine decarboxylase/phosphopantothenate--cysteine ligase CoaBC [Halalkalibacterium halodurans]MED3647016.1 bifunctional phosphopantothenoylcysteine decarboxylase/phosphopantothenate--cysteine ligase CoaBC [Halalkalibacterium halodurans]MED4161785.1 bifunctional phosphopantothenoylcysteine decarboxylase/phosphopantothenate--cysteine ligase CoaBC [Halalkalibacterium halodurans]